jgi:hypothetical protein
MFGIICSFFLDHIPFSSKAEQKDALNNIVLLAHLHLQSEGFLSTWTNSFVGPWDPSQGEHNPGNIYMWCLLNMYIHIFLFSLSP